MSRKQNNMKRLKRRETDCSHFIFLFETPYSFRGLNKTQLLIFTDFSKTAEFFTVFGLFPPFF